MADGEKPYRVYRGGRVKGKVPAPPRPSSQPSTDGASGADSVGPAPVTKPKGPRRLRWVLLALGVFALLLVIWFVASYFSFRDGVKAANKRLPREARAPLARQDGLLLSHASTILLLGTDHAPTKARESAHRSDSILVVRTDPDHHRIAYLSIPRDLRVEIPGRGTGKINAAFQLGGPALAVRAVQHLTGLPISHLVVVDFADFEDLIDRVGGVTIDIPAPILSNRFDCPYATAARCQRWEGWRFRKGKQHMDGQRALVYSRIRENRLNPAENDITRGERQQAVLQAIAGKLTSFGTLVRLPFIGGDLLKPLSTDLSPGDFLQLGWVKFRASGGRTLHCRLGGSPSQIGGQSYIIGTEENVSVIHMVTGDSAPQPPLPGSGPFGPGCAVGNNSLR